MKSKHIINYRFFYFIIGILLIAGNLFAKQEPHHRPPALPDSIQIVEMIDELDATLLLTDVQRSAISRLHFTHFEEANELIEEHEGDRENHRQAMDDLREDFDAQVKEILTDEQITEFEKFMESRQRHHDENRPGHK